MIIQSGAHMDDGGMFTNLMVNGQTFCDSAATYNATPAYYEPNGYEDKAHISNMSECNNVGFVKVGDKLTLEAFYDSQNYPLRLTHNGTAYPVMGIGLVYTVPSSYYGPDLFY
jgi:hypothetical protein